ncbi:SPOR domain-containing protein [Pseudofulvimonas gallinarii]|uniref:Sporulation related protein n=1 Tax=Pseudofulvimonas gallinarii TaxID=634155 RepID=A0A4S3KX05_9GAMM|nr:SPOR domain-containing protein [Pseudofulvimonas gallinarii]TCS98435.1 sporulation related protein [Pseudofulvimonas gallinarii]THD13760.1 hypothetical protein B1808_06945 [Pseudofulvimonas gallinarii]
MARRTSHARRGKSGNGIPAWLWLVAGIALGLGLALAAIYGGIAPSLRQSPDMPQPAAASRAPAGDAAEAPPTGTGKPRYDFYTVLPEMEVLIPDSELREQVRAETPATGTAAVAPVAPPETVTAVRYRLQAGSYRDPRPAEEAKARLALLGITATVQSVNVNGATYHRIYVGPFNSAAEVERVKQQLADNGVQAITVKEASP